MEANKIGIIKIDNCWPNGGVNVYISYRAQNSVAGVYVPTVPLYCTKLYCTKGSIGGDYGAY